MADEVAEEHKVENLKAGDYMIHVFLEVGKQFEMPEGEDDVDPIIEVMVGTQKQYSEGKEQINQMSIVQWQQHLFFDLKKQEPDDLQELKIKIKILDKGYFKDAIIGETFLDFMSVYQKKDHALLHQWLGLNNANGEDPGKIQCYLKASIQCTHSTDETIKISEESGMGDEENIMMPTSVKPTYKELTLRIFMAQNLPFLDTNILTGQGSIDAFFKTYYKKTKLKSKIVTTKTHEVHWNQELLIPIMLPVSYGKQIIQVFDYDMTGNDIVASLIFDTKDFLEKYQPDKLFWKNLYGSPIEYSNDAAEKMNKNPTLASTWKGRFLMSVSTKDSEQPQATIREIDKTKMEKFKADIERMMKPKKYQVFAEVGQGVDLPESKKYRIKIAFGDQELITKEPVSQIDNYNRWDERFEKAITMVYEDRLDIGSVFVYLMDGKKAIAFKRFSVNEFRDPNPQMKFFRLKPDTAADEIDEDYQAGIVSFKLYLHNTQRDGHFVSKEHDAWKKQPSGGKKKVLKVRVNVFQCRDLPAVDDAGVSDPYVKIWDTTDRDIRTNVVHETINPVYYETKTLKIEANSKEEMPPFIFTVFDQDTGALASDDYMCKAIIPIEECATESSQGPNFPPEPKWHKLFEKEGGAQRGEILLSFNIVEENFKFILSEDQFKLESFVNHEDFKCQLNVLGLRNLASSGLLPVKKAYINFKVRNLLPPGSAQAIENVLTKPSATGPDPTINTTIKFVMSLPQKELYCPKLQCQVHDQILAGWIEPLIGNFVIPLGEIIFDKQREREERLDALDQIIETLQNVLKGEGIRDYSNKKSITKVEQVMDQEDKNRMRQEKKKRAQTIEYNKKKESVNKALKNPSSLLDQKGAIDKAESKIKKDIKDDQKRPLLQQMNDENDEYSGSEGGSDLDDGKEYRPPIDLANQDHISGDKKQKSATVKVTDKQDQIKEVISNVKSSDNKKSTKVFDGSNPKQSPRVTPKDIENKLNKNKESQSPLDKQGGVKFDAFKDGNKKAIMKAHQEETARLKRLASNTTQSALMEFQRENPDKTGVVVDATYSLLKRLNVQKENRIPPASVYVPVGYDEEPDVKGKPQNKHYRQFFNDELEQVEKFMKKPSPFEEYFLRKGQIRKKKGFFDFFQGDDDELEVDPNINVGKFKGLINIYTQEDMDEFQRRKKEKIDVLMELIEQIALKEHGLKIDFDEDQLFDAKQRAKFKADIEEVGLGNYKITRSLTMLLKEDILERLLLKQEKVIVRVYVLGCFDLASRDSGGESDPYLWMQLGKQVVNQRSKHQNDEPNPEINEVFDFEAIFPGCPMLHIKMMDYDMVFGDEVIGETFVDLEDRYFSPEWRSVKDMPVEYRRLYHNSSKAEQGIFKMWAELIPVNEAPNVKKWDITAKPAEHLEIRVVVWGSKNLKMMDAEGTCDAFVRLFFDPKHKKETDVHYRNSDGKANWNYRLLFPFDYNSSKMNENECTLTVQTYDLDLLTANDLVGQATINLEPILQDVELTHRQMSVTKEYYKTHLKQFNGWNKIKFEDDTSFWVDMMSMEKGKKVNNGQIRISIDILEKVDADANKVGEARSEPNLNPYLPKPEGRLEFSLNPFKMLMQLVGPEFRRKIYCYCCLIICAALFIFMAPVIISDGISDMLF